MTPPEDPLALLAATLSADSLGVAAHQLVAALAAQGGHRRVALGLCREGAGLRIEALSDLALRSAPPELVAALAGALQEAIDQNAVLCVPGTGSMEVVTLEHRVLQERGGGCVASIPFGVGGIAHGALLLQRSGDAYRRAELDRIEHLLVLAAPALRWMLQAELGWRSRLVQAWRQCRPRRRGAAAAAAAALALLALVPLEHQVGGRARLEGAEQRVLVAPGAGFVKAVHVHPGDRVAAGAALVDLADADLRLEQERWNSQLTQQQNAYAAAMARSDRTLAAVSLARGDEAQAQLELVQTQLERSRLRAPFDGVVIAGDLSQSIGSPVRQGDTLVTLARSDQFRVIVDIDEFDIGAVQPGQRGELALSSLPWRALALEVERVTPLAKAAEGANVFEVQARLLEPASHLRPGLQGHARLTVGRLAPLRAWCRRPLERLALALWAWGL